MSAERGQLAAVPRRLLGAGFVLVVVAFLAFTIASYRQVFTPVTWVELHAARTGTQLVPHADVKLRGVTVGEVRDVSSNGGGVTFRLAIDPDKTDLIPKNVTAQLLPKTLFGERYVNFVMPAIPSPARLAAGDVIGEDRTSGTVELNRVFDNLMPLLQAVQPQKLAVTLNAVATALSDGRGTQLGQTLVQLNDYVRSVDPSLPDLTADLRSLAGVADTYTAAAPDILQGLNDLTTTTRTVLERRSELEALYGTVTAASDDLNSFVTANKENLISLAGTARPTLDLLAKYSPEFPCFFKQLAAAGDRLNQVWGGGKGDHKLHLTVEVTAARGKYLPGKDEPRYADKRGPACYELPASGNAPQYPAGGPIKDGSTAVAPPPGGGGGAAGGGSAPGQPNSPEERALVNALIGAQTGTPPAQYPDWSSVLAGPLYRGAEVTVR
jgi:phospholipid/cholesterol/gamma-HCH transport system substrate-binding protein